MRKFVKRLKSEEDGLTLIEMIASLSIMSMVMITVYAVIHFGFDSYHKITIENSLRDEGDLLMSSVIAELYKYGPESIEQLTNGIALKGSANQPTITIAGGALQISETGANNGQIATKSTVAEGSKIILRCKGDSSSCSSGLIEISLVLSQSYGGRAQSMNLVSRFGF